MAGAPCSRLSGQLIACVAYVASGNFATHIPGGAQYGYMLLWVIVASNLMAMLVQYLSAKLGVATDKKSCRNVARIRSTPSGVAHVVAELVAKATGFAKFLEAALSFHLLFGIPLLPAGLITAVTTVLILVRQEYGFRPLEAVIGALIGVNAVSGLFAYPHSVVAA